MLAEVAASISILDIGSNRLKRIGPEFSRLQGLTKLFLGANRISAVENLDDGLPNLRVLSLQANTLRSAKGLANLRSLKELYLSENKLTSLDGLPIESPELEILDIAR